MAGSTLASPSAEIAAVRPAAAFSPGRDAWRRFRRHRLAVLSLGVLGVIVLAVAFGPFVWRLAINDIDFAAQLKAPTLAHPFGTDDLGQDILARLISGGRISLAVGLAAMLVATLVGVVVGATAGMSRGHIDAALMWLADLFLSLPQLPLLLLVIYLFRDSLKSIYLRTALCRQETIASSPTTTMTLSFVTRLGRTTPTIYTLASTTF